jgi:hypothetical protein
MSQHKVYPVPDDVAQHAHLDRNDYERMYQRSLEDADTFWAEQAEQFLWQGGLRTSVTPGRPSPRSVPGTGSGSSLR